MSFSQFKSLSQTLQEFQITYTETDFVQDMPFDISDYFRSDLQLTLEDAVVDNSEYAICENLIYPILKEVWKPYRHKFTLWSHECLNCDAQLTGFPEYILAQRSPLGKVVFDKPYFALVEAKQDNFDEAWGQCLAEMIAAQRLNGTSDMIVYGITSNGSFWQFGHLNQATFVKNRRPYTLYELDSLFGAIHYIFHQADQQLAALSSSTA